MEAKTPRARLMGVSTAIFSLAILHDILLAHFVLSGSAWAPLAFSSPLWDCTGYFLLNRRYVSKPDIGGGDEFRVETA